jgi:hypothetical protein
MEAFKKRISTNLLFAMLFLGLVPTPLLAQNEAQEVEQVIRSLFEGMKLKNANQVSQAFYAEGLMQTVIQKAEGTTVGSNTVADFVNRIANTPEEVVLDEQVLSYRIQVDGAMAAAWTPYRFYRNGEFSHCGVNSFQLVKMAEGWKIVYIIDTRRKEPCEY